jgi:pimeloyl-ACP methyl ester carboxylesterase
MRVGSRGEVWMGVALALAACAAAAQKPVTIAVPNQTALVRGDLYGSGERGIVLAHGGRFNKESWAKQAQVFADAGFVVLAIDFRGDRLNPDGTPSAEGSDADNAADVLAAVRYLHGIGVRHVHAVGGSLGGDAVGNADVLAKPGEIERMVFLGSEGGDEPEKLTGRELYIVARGDANDDGPRIVPIRAHYARAPQPKKLIVVEGTAHAQYLFATDQGPRVMREILRFMASN